MPNFGIEYLACPILELNRTWRSGQTSFGWSASLTTRSATWWATARCERRTWLKRPPDVTSAIGGVGV